MISFRTIAVLACVCMAPPLFAEPAELLTYDSLPGRIHAANPDLKAARLRIREALGRLKQAGRPDNPELETSIEHDRRFREGRVEVGISQRFPVTGRLALEKKVSLAAVDAAEAEVRNVERKLVADARTSFVKVLAIRLQRDLLKEQEALAGTLAETAGKVAQRGEGSPLEAGQAKLEAARLAAEARKLDAEEAAAMGALKPLLGLSPDSGLHVSGKLADPTLPQGGKLIRRPDLEAAGIEAKAAESDIALEEAKRRQDVQAGFFFSADRAEDAPEGLKNEAMVGLKFTIPLPFWDKNEGGIEEAVAKRDRKQAEVTALRESIRHEAAAALAEMAEWEKMLRELDRDLLPLAAKQKEATEDAWQKGQGELPSIFRAREQALEMSAARLNALREFHLARVRYEAALGNP